MKKKKKKPTRKKKGKAKFNFVLFCFFLIILFCFFQSFYFVFFNHFFFDHFILFYFVFLFSFFLLFQYFFSLNFFHFQKFFLFFLGVSTQRTSLPKRESRLPLSAAAPSVQTLHPQLKSLFSFYIGLFNGTINLSICKFPHSPDVSAYRDLQCFFITLFSGKTGTLAYSAVLPFFFS